MPSQQSELKQQLGDALCNQAIGIRQRRRLVEQRWLNNRRTWFNLPVDDRFRGSDSSALYRIPAARRALERSIVRCVKLLTPNVKWFEVAPMSGVSQQKLTNVDKYMWYVLRKRIKSKSNISQLVRSMFMYGECHLKTSIAVRNGQVWPTHRVVDPFAFYRFPETVSTTDEAEVVFEDFLFSYERYETFFKKGIVDVDLTNDLTKPDWPYHLTERLAYQGITDPTADVDIAIQRVGDQLEKTTAAFVSLTEMWITKEDKLYQVYIAWNTKRGPKVVGFIESVYDTPLYRSAIHRPLPGEMYTNSFTEDVVQLDGLVNDQLNQFHEAVDKEQGFIAMHGAQRHDSWKFKGSAIWMLQDDPKDIMQFIQPPNTSTNLLRAFQIDLGLINSMGGSGTIAEGQPGRNMPRAGTAVNNLINLGMADLQDVAELIEQEVLTPGLSDIYKVSQQFLPDSQLMMIPGGEALYNGQKSTIIKKLDIIGDYEFEWVGSLQFQDEAMRSQRLLIWLNMLPQLAPMLQQQGYAFDVVGLVRMIWRYGLGERGLADVVIPLAELAGKVAAASAQQGLQSMMQGGAGGSGTNGQPIPANGNSQQPPPTNGIPGLNYRLPNVTNGFVKQ